MNKPLVRNFFFDKPDRNQLAVSLLVGDITTFRADGIVNAANSWLLNGGGVTGAIFGKASPEFRNECERIGYCPPGRAILTGNTGKSSLLCRGIIHMISLPWQTGRQEQLRALTHEAYLSTFLVAENAQFATLAIPAMGTGVYGHPIPWAANVAYDALLDYLTTYGFITLEQVKFVLFDEQTFHIYNSVFSLRREQEEE